MSDVEAAARAPAEENVPTSGEQNDSGGEPLVEGGEQSSSGAAANVGESDAETEDDQEAGAAAGATRGKPAAVTPPSSSASARRPVAFQSAHALKFGLEVVAREPAPSARVTAVLCLFCKHFGREPKPGAKRRATTNFKYFKGVFRTDQYLQHHRLQHPVKWAEYDAASVREKQTFFPRYLMAADATESLSASSDAVGDDAHGVKSLKGAKKPRRGDAVGEKEGTRQDDARQRETDVGAASEIATAFEIPAHVVALLFGDEPWQPLSLPSCKRSIQTNGEAIEQRDGREVLFFGPSPVRTNEAKDVYRGVLPDRLSFDMTVDLCATRLSTNQATQALRAMATYVPNGAALASVWYDLVDSYAQVATLGSLTLLSDIFASAWAFSLGFHRHGAVGEQIVEVRVRFLHFKIREFHLCCLRVDEINEKLPRVLSTVHPTWQQTLTGVSIAGDVFSAAALGSAIQSLRDSAVTRGTVWVTWNGNDLLHRAVLQLFQQLQGGSFATVFRRLKAYVKSQSRLVQEIGHESQPYTGVVGSSDETIAEITATARWFTDKRVRIRKYFEEASESSATTRPSESWWLCLAIFDWITAPAEQAMRDIRVRLDGLIPGAQLTILQELETDISTAFRVGAVVPGDEATANAVKYLSTLGTHAATKTGVLEFVVELGSFVNSLLTSFGHDELDATLESLGTSVASFVETLKTGCHHGYELTKLCGGGLDAATNTAFNSLLAPPPPVLPQEMVKLSGKALSALLAQYRAQLLTCFTEADLDAMEQEHQALKRVIREKDFRAWASDAPADRLDHFDSAWLKTTGRFRLLHAFAGGLATVLPPHDVRPREDHLTGETSVPTPPAATTTAMLNIAIEAPLHAAQFHELQRVWRLLPSAV